ncbi:hypothetical protein IE4872_PB00087 (plasmid) [Rhizobium gallicum]|uniref:Uncharacterized protein n=1 Tax=Rhizobium gallicum TaxID=56730 RepID=A0A1L5NPZ7_9HYPH|nr:hypothetical protein [Rhizobium gallicum]APO69958.1 hypothetical protein IE4872_PB00087 [Rhizobium gallicum]
MIDGQSIGFFDVGLHEVFGARVGLVWPRHSWTFHGTTHGCLWGTASFRKVLRFHTRLSDAYGIRLALNACTRSIVERVNVYCRLALR